MPAIEEVAKPATDPTKVSALALQNHQDRMAARREARAKRLSDLIQCLDAETAGNAEAEKPKFRFKIKCTIQEMDKNLKRMMPVEKSGQVDAQNADDAWAIFCDKWKVRTGPNHCNRVIEKLSRKRSAIEAVEN